MKPLCPGYGDGMERAAGRHRWPIIEPALAYQPGGSARVVRVCLGAAGRPGNVLAGDCAVATMMVWSNLARKAAVS
jgi:hypothetical protein